MTQFSEGKVLGIYHTETPSKKCGNKWVHEKGMWEFLANADLTWKARGSTAKSGHCREAEAGIASFLRQDCYWVVGTMTHPNSWNPIIRFLRHASFSVFLLESFVYLYHLLLHSLCDIVRKTVPIGGWVCSYPCVVSLGRFQHNDWWISKFLLVDEIWCFLKYIQTLTLFITGLSFIIHVNYILV